MSIASKLTKLETDITNAYNTINLKGGTIPANKNTENLSNAINSIQSGGSATLITKTLTENRTYNAIDDNADGYSSVTIEAFFKPGYGTMYFRNMIFPSTVGQISSSGFSTCTNLETVTFESGLTAIYGNAFSNCTGLKTVQLPNTIEEIYMNVFRQCENLETINIPNSLTSLNSSIFSYCTKLKNVTIENGFNCDNLFLNSSTIYTQDIIVSWLQALADRTGLSAYTLTIGSTNLSKLTSSDIAIATNKNWNLS